MIPRQRRVASRHVLLDDDAAAHRLDRTVKYRDKTIASGLDEPSVMFRDAGLDEVALDSLDAQMRAFFIDLHETAVARDVTSHDCRKTSWRQPAPRRIGVACILGGINIAKPWHGRYLSGRFRGKCERGHCAQKIQLVPARD